jgi:hypothetical protein
MKFFINIFITISATCLALFVAEIGVWLISPSILTPMPHEFLRMANRPNIEGIDENGFRNPRRFIDYEIGAIGDSFTFGYNVKSKNSWPSILESNIKIPVYNYGVGGFNYLDYYQTAEFAFEDVNSLIVAIYLGNDLTQGVCVAARLPYWRDHRVALDLKLMCSSAIADQDYSLANFIDHSRLVSLARYSLVHALPQLVARFSGFLLTPPQIVDYSVDERFLRYAAASTDLNSPFVARSFSDAISVLNDLKALARRDGKRLAIMLIPSQSRILAEFGDLEVEHRDVIALGAANEANLIDAFGARLADDCVPMIDATSWLAKGLEQALRDGQFFWAPGGDDHLLKPGYTALASAASKAVEHWMATEDQCGHVLSDD